MQTKMVLEKIKKTLPRLNRKEERMHKLPKLRQKERISSLIL
jgi:hypothetical protein